MARTDTLGNFLTDVAEAIRAKEGTTETIAASEFDTRISNLSGGGSEDLSEELTAQDEKITAQENVLKVIKTALKNKSSSGEMAPYAPRFVSFYGYTGTDLTTELENLDTSNITNMSSMFYGCSNVTELDVSKFDTSNVTSMGSMFYGCSKITELDLSNWDTSNLSYVRMMFSNCSKLSSINWGNFNIGTSSDLGYFLTKCYALQEIDFSSLDFSTVTSLQETFANCSALKEVVLPEKIKSGISLKQTFYYCSSLTSIEMLGVTTVGDWFSTFYNCSSLQYLDMRNVDMTSSAPSRQTFTGVPSTCEIIVKDDATRNILLGIRSDFTNIKTVAELEV